MSRPKLTILATVGNYLPGYKAGGQLRTVCNMVNVLGDEFDFRIVTSDRDLGDLKPYDGIVADTWLRVGKALVYYVSSRRRGLSHIAHILNSTPHDVLYLNSFFSPLFTIKPLLAMRFGLARRTPTVIASRGEFSSGAIALKSRKKLAYLRFYNSFLHKNPVLFHATSPFEVDDINSFIRKRHETFVAQDVVSMQEMPAQGLAASDAGGLRACFISRVSPMKNLCFALEVLLKVKEAVSFDIYGPIEDGDYWGECTKAIEQLPSNVRANYCGQLSHDMVVSTFAHYDLFLFPTRGENFGHVVVESLLAGTSVLISNQTPWKDFERDGVGWVLPLDDPATWARRIDEFACVSPDERFIKRNAARKFAESVCLDPNVINANRELFVRAAAM